MTEAERKRFENVEYIRTTRDLQFEDRKGRYTVLTKGSPGVILDANNIDDISYLSEKQRRECFEMLSIAQRDGQTFALVQGYRCIISPSDFFRCEAPKIYPVTSEII